MESRAALVVSTQRKRWTPALKWKRRSQPPPWVGEGERVCQVSRATGTLWDHVGKRERGSRLMGCRTG